MEGTCVLQQVLGSNLCASLENPYYWASAKRKEMREREEEETAACWALSNDVKLGQLYSENHTQTFPDANDKGPPASGGFVCCTADMQSLWLAFNRVQQIQTLTTEAS